MTTPAHATPTTREVFFDARGPRRAMRVSAHPAHGVTVVSLWRDDTCVGTLHLPDDEVPRLIAALGDGLAASLPSQPRGQAS